MALPATAKSSEVIAMAMYTFGLRRSGRRDKNDET